MHPLTDRRVHTAGQLLAVGFDGTSPPQELLRRIRQGRLGAVVYFARNVVDPAQLAELSNELLASAPPDRPLLLAVDQEGGRVRRLRDPWPSWPSAARMGASRDAGLVRRAGRAVGEELAACGIRVDLAPVLDVHTNPANPVIGDRAFGHEPRTVADLAGAFADGLQDVGLASCGKHFPGHGDTSQDSHLELPVVAHPLARLLEVELVPFTVLAPRLPALMTAHVLFPALDPDRVATLSPTILGTWLRERLGFRGLILSDDLEMRAVSDRAGVGEIAVSAVEAGVDLLAICRDPERQEAALEALERAAERHSFAARLSRAAEAVATFKRRFCCATGADPVAALRLATSPSHHQLAQQLGGPETARPPL